MTTKKVPEVDDKNYTLFVWLNTVKGWLGNRDTDLICVSPFEGGNAAQFQQGQLSRMYFLKYSI